jgi:hypothetical protein
VKILRCGGPAVALLFFAGQLSAQQTAPAARSSDVSQQPNVIDLMPGEPEGHTYVELPLQELIKRLPELKDVRAVADQKQLPAILQSLGRSVDQFMENIGNLIADEEVIQQILRPNGKVKAKQVVRDDYLIVHEGHAWGAGSEYRMDRNGRRLESIGLTKGYIVTTGHALSCIVFSSVNQSEAAFRLLGETRIDARNAYVLAFAGKPGEVTFTTVMQGDGGNDVKVMTHGILWVDKENFQILRMRSDIVAPSNALGLEQLSTEIAFARLQLQDMADAIWLPKDVTVTIRINGAAFRNFHHYANYRRYRVEIKMKPA